MATATEQKLQAKTLSTSLTVDDVNKSIQFFEGLGFAISERWEDAGKLTGVMMQAGNAEIGLSQDDWKKGRNRQKGIGISLYLDTDQDIDQLAARAKEHGVKLDADPHDNDWGPRSFEATEPSGFKISIMEQG
jgi:uncharacterized glyoxalase superfamily protein PhnB